MIFFKCRADLKWHKEHVAVLERKIFELNYEIGALKFILGKTPKSLQPQDVYMAKQGLYRVLTQEDKRR